MLRPIRVLHLEDNPRDAEMIGHRLHSGGVPCDITLVDGKEGFETALTREPFDLILCDHNLPDYDGATALKRAQATQPQAPVILISGTVVDEQAVKCLLIGATDYLLKDRLDRLVPAVERALHEAETRRARKRVEVALSQSEARKAAIMDSVLDCIITVDADGTVVEFNAAASRTFGYAKGDAIGRPLADLIIPPRFRETLSAGLAGYVATGQDALIGKLMEIKAMRSDGCEMPVELAITAVRSGSATLFTSVLRDITDRLQATATCARLATIVDSSDDSILSLAMDGTILTWNAGAERLYGYAAEEMIGRNIDVLVPAGKSAELVAVMKRAANGEAGESLETQRTRKDKSLVDISLIISPMRDAAGRITSVSAIARDITSRKEREASLHYERDRAQQFLDTAEVILLKLDVEGRILLVNRYACEVLGWTGDELLGRDWIETCVPVNMRNESKATFGNPIGRDVSITENPILTRSGEIRLFEWRTRALHDDEGRVIGSFGSGTDITDRNLAVDALRKAEERVRFVLDAAGVGIWERDCATGTVRLSDIVESQYGLLPGTFDGTFEAFMACIHPDDRQSVQETVGKAMRLGSDFSVEHRVLWPDKTVRWLSSAGRYLLGEDGKPLRGIAISQDVTERHTLEAQYHQAQKMEAVGRLAGGVAHDFNNLLTVILGYCELLLADLPPEDPRQADIVGIQNAGMHAGVLTRKLLAFSRKEIIQPKLLDLNAIVIDMQVLLGRLIGEDVTVVLGLGSALAFVKADRGEVERIIVNLAVNARDAMPRGGTLTIETANVELDGHEAPDRPALTPGHYVVLTVTDTGTGMTPEVKAHLFEPFFTTKEAGKGTGLGLATVHAGAAANGGAVTVDSEVGRGTAFRVYFPHVAAPELIVAAQTLVQPPPAGGLTVLVVEDEEGLRHLTRRILERQGYTVLVAANAADACHQFDEHPAIDLLLTDVVMPGASGPELVKQLVERRPKLKVLYMSGYTDEAISRHGVLDSGIVFLQKPFTSESLGQKLREVLEAVGHGVPLTRSSGLQGFHDSSVGE